MSDSLMIEATGHAEHRLIDVLRLSSLSGVNGTSIDGTTLVLHEYAHDAASPLPAVMAPEACAPIIKAWLDHVTYGQEPNIDGECKRGWKISASRLSHSIRVAPHWMIFHK